MDWFTLAIALGSAAMLLAAAIFIYLFASEFFMQQPYVEWVLIGGSMSVLAIAVGLRPFMEGFLTDLATAGVVVGCGGLMLGFGQAYRRSAGGIR